VRAESKEESVLLLRLVDIGRGVEEESRKMRTRRWKWFLRRFTLALAVAAVAVPTAQARIDEGINGQPNSAQEIASQDVARTFTDGRLAPAGSSVDVARTFTDGRLAPAGSIVVHTGEYMPHAGLNEYLQSREIGGPTVVASPGFSWGDAGLGAGLMLAALLVIGGSVLASRQLSKPQTA
jgi:hypothetical protein